MLLTTANGIIRADKCVVIDDSALGAFDALLLEQCPPAVSVGTLCKEWGWSFIWNAFCDPYYVLLDGRFLKMIVEDNVPYLDADARITNERPTPKAAAATPDVRDPDLDLKGSWEPIFEPIVGKQVDAEPSGTGCGDAPSAPNPPSVPAGFDRALYDRLRHDPEEAITRRHRMMHLPNNVPCPHCMQGKNGC